MPEASTTSRAGALGGTRIGSGTAMSLTAGGGFAGPGIRHPPDADANDRYPAPAGG